MEFEVTFAESNVTLTINDKLIEMCPVFFVLVKLQSSKLSERAFGGGCQRSLGWRVRVGAVFLENNCGMACDIS